MHSELIDFITEATNNNDNRLYITWEFFYYYKHTLMKCELIRELNQNDGLRSLLIEHHVGAPNPLSLEKHFHEFLPSAYKCSRYTPRMTYFQNGDINGRMYSFSFLIRTANDVEFFVHQNAKESKYEISKNKVLRTILDAGDEGISRTQLFRINSHFTPEQKTQIIKELTGTSLIYEKKDNSVSMFFIYDQQKEDRRKEDEVVAEYWKEQAAEEQAEKDAQEKEVEEPIA